MLPDLVIFMTRGRGIPLSFLVLPSLPNRTQAKAMWLLRSQDPKQATDSRHAIPSATFAASEAHAQQCRCALEIWVDLLPSPMHLCISHWRQLLTIGRCPLEVQSLLPWPESGPSQAVKYVPIPQHSMRPSGVTEQGWGILSSPGGFCLQLLYGLSGNSSEWSLTYCCGQRPPRLPGMSCSCFVVPGNAFQSYRMGTEHNSDRGLSPPICMCSCPSFCLSY